MADEDENFSSELIIRLREHELREPSSSSSCWLSFALCVDTCHIEIYAVRFDKKTAKMEKTKEEAK
jgi:hypothetical protein